jgi:hypothetical protein
MQETKGEKRQAVDFWWEGGGCGELMPVFMPSSTTQAKFRQRKLFQQKEKGLLPHLENPKNKK